MDMERAGSGDEELVVLPPATHQDVLGLTLLPSRSYSSGAGAGTGTNVVDDVDSGGGAAPGRRLVASLEQELLYRADLQHQQHGAAGSGADQRKRRAMKNRESAERSRARKQAYLQELEQEVRLLRAENAALRDQCEELKDAAAAAEAPPATKPTLQRASSATF